MKLRKLLLISLFCLVHITIFSKEVSIGFLAEYANFNNYRSYVEEDPNFDIYLRVFFNDGLVLSIHQLNYASAWLYRYDYNESDSLVNGGYTYSDESSDFKYFYGYRDIFMTDLSIGRYTSLWDNRVNIVTQAGPTIIIPGQVVIGFNEDNLMVSDDKTKYQNNIDTIHNNLTLVDYFGINLSLEVTYRFSYLTMVMGLKYFTPLRELQDPEIGNFSLYVGPAISF